MPNIFRNIYCHFRWWKEPLAGDCQCKIHESRNISYKNHRLPKLRNYFHVNHFCQLIFRVGWNIDICSFIVILNGFMVNTLSVNDKLFQNKNKSNKIQNKIEITESTFGYIAFISDGKYPWKRRNIKYSDLIRLKALILFLGKVRKKNSGNK